MAEKSIPLQELSTDGWPAPLRGLLEAIEDVARRLGHNVLVPEHLLIVGAENGVEEMARAAPNLAAFREALLDLLHDAREQLRRGRADGKRREVFVRQDLVAALRRIEAGENATELLVEFMRGDEPRIRRALGAARGSEPEIVPPGTLTLDREAALDPSLAGSLSAAEAAASSAAAPRRAGSRPQAQARPSRRPQVIPLTTDLCQDAAEDAPLVGRAAFMDQVARILLRFHQPCVLIVGEPGAGKSAFVRGLARAACNAELAGLSGYRFHQLRLLDLIGQSHRGQDIHDLTHQLLQQIEQDPTGVLVVDDLQQLIARQGYPLVSDVLDTLKLRLKGGKLRAILAVDGRDYERTLAADAFFGGELTTRRLPPLGADDLSEILHDLRPRLERHFKLKIEDAALEAAVARSLAEGAADYLPPGSTIRLVDEACAMARAAGQGLVTAGHVARAADDELPSEARVFSRERLAGLADALSARVLGQAFAADAVARRVRLAKLRLDRRPERPDGVFLFLGPSGVGKTEMARSLARALYDDESHLVRIDMSEYLEAHSIARIVGAPPGYVGYGEEGALTGPIARLGHGVVLLDEIEKAHPQVLNLFLQVFDDGRLTDSKGRVVDFSETVIIMTSNIGRELYAMTGDRPIGFGRSEAAGGPLRDAVQEHLLRVLPPEFVNRIDEIVPFRVLDESDMLDIAARILAAETERWTSRGKRLVFDDEVVKLVATRGYDARLGARHVERNVERMVISLLSDAAVSEVFDGVEELRLAVENDTVCLRLDGKPFVCLPGGPALRGGDAPRPGS